MILGRKMIGAIVAGMTFLSPDIKNIRQIPFLKVTSLNEKMSGKVGFGLKNDLKV